VSTTFRRIERGRPLSAPLFSVPAIGCPGTSARAISQLAPRESTTSCLVLPASVTTVCRRARARGAMTVLHLPDGTAAAPGRVPNVAWSNAPAASMIPSSNARRMFVPRRRADSDHPAGRAVRALFSRRAQELEPPIRADSHDHTSFSSAPSIVRALSSALEEFPPFSFGVPHRDSQVIGHVVPPAA